MNIIVGCIAAFSVFWHGCDRMLNYKSRADMHTGAKVICKDLLADLDFTLIKFQSLSEAARTNPDNDPMPPQTLADIKTKLDQVQECCTSAVPDAINQVFKQMNSLVAFDLDIQGLDKAGREDIQLLRIANVLLCKEITKSLMWPMKLPGAAICWKARSALVAELKIEEKNDLRQIREATFAQRQHSPKAATAPAAAPAATKVNSRVSACRTYAGDGGDG